MLSELVIRIIKDKLELLLIEQNKMLDDALINSDQISKITDLDMEVEKTKASLEVVSKILGE